MTQVGLNQAVLNSISAGVVVLNQHGRIVSTNAAWSKMALDNGLDPMLAERQVGAGSDYLAACDQGAPEVRTRIESVLSGESPGFRMDYRCDSPLVQRWFNMDVAPLGPGGQGVVITHTDITERVSNEVAMRAEARRVQALSQRVLRLQEMERRTVAQQLHEGLAQALTILKLNLQAAAGKRAPQAHLADNLAIVEESLQQVRRLALTLRPAMLDDLGLAPALEWLTTEVGVWAGIEASFDCASPEARYAPEVETAYFRIAQEALNNVTSHADAQHVRVSLQRDQGCLVLCVEDDGIGFDTDKQDQMDGDNLGLLDMRERAAIIEARFSLVSAPGLGCSVRLFCPTAPLHAPAEPREHLAAAPAADAGAERRGCCCNDATEPAAPEC